MRILRLMCFIVWAICFGMLIGLSIPECFADVKSVTFEFISGAIRLLTFIIGFTIIIL